MSTLSSLEQQLAALKATTAVPYAPPVTPSIPSLDDIRTMVKELLISELGGVVKQLPQIEPPEKLLTMEDALNSILTGDDQKWLMNADNVKKLPHFMLSDIGKPLTQQFIKEFRSQYES
jgi:hypothetical protein